MDQISLDAYAARRARLIENMEEGAVAIFPAGGEKTRSHDTEYRFRPHSDFVYLSGFEEPESILVVAPGRTEGPFVLFVRPRDEAKEIWNGRRAGVQGAVERFGADSAYPLEELDEVLPGLLKDATSVYFDLGADRDLDRRLLGHVAKLRRQRGRPSAAPTAIRDPRPILHAMRLIKSSEEIALLRRACAITAEAHLKAMKVCKPGLFEYQLQAIIEYIFAKHGAAAPSYGTIVGGGANGAILHYTENLDALVDGQLVLIDAGAEYKYYAGDITRTFPVNGKFTPVQRDLYQAVLEAEKKGVSMCGPGSSVAEIHEETAKLLTQSMVDMGLLKGSVDALLEEKAYAKFYMHRTGHYLGMDVHDVGPYYHSADQPRALSPGMVQTIEPGIYIQPGMEGVSEEFWGIGIRIEDDVLTTENGFEVLTGGVPKEIAELEAVIGTDPLP